MDQPPNILLVDDNPVNLTALETVLAGPGQNVVLARSGREALKQVLQHEFAVIILDVNMPEMDGFETANLIRQRPRCEHTPIIFVTAYSTSDIDRATGYRLGGVDYLFRPIVTDVLRSKVGVFVQLFQARRQVEQQAAQMASLNWELESRLGEVQRLNRELADANQELEAFTYSVSHDLRAPANQIIGFVELLKSDCKDQLDDRGKEYVDWIRDGAGRLVRLIDDLLSLSKISLATLHGGSVDLTKVAREIVADLKRADPDRLVDVSVTKGLTARGDSGLIRVALENLLGNAWKFTSHNEEARIEVGSLKDTQNGHPVYFVRDNGAGFDSRYADKLFTPFQRLHTSAEFEGTGIGLATVQRIVRRHGGRIWAEGAPEEGATFYFTLAS